MSSFTVSRRILLEFSSGLYVFHFTNLLYPLFVAQHCLQLLTYLFSNHFSWHKIIFIYLFIFYPLFVVHTCFHLLTYLFFMCL